MKPKDNTKIDRFVKYFSELFHDHALSYRGCSIDIKEGEESEEISTKYPHRLVLKFADCRGKEKPEYWRYYWVTRYHK
jgi:hypothetical protein